MPAAQEGAVEDFDGMNQPTSNNIFFLKHLLQWKGTGWVKSS